MVKVLHILTRLIRGGADESTVAAVAGLRKHHFDATLLIGGDSDKQYAHEASSLAKLHYESFLRRDVRPASDLAALCRLYSLMKRERYTIVHTNTAKAGIIGRFAARLAGVPIIVHTVHGISFHDFRHPLMRRLFIACEKTAARMTDRFIAVGRDLQNYYVRHGIGKPEQYQIVHTGMDIHKFFQAGERVFASKREELGLAPTDVVVGNVSRLVPGKGQKYLLQAAPQILRRFPRVKFLLVGDGPDSINLSRMAHDLQIEDHVIFSGFRHDIEEVMSLFDIAVFTSLWEGLPRVVVQYSAVGKPIVAFDIPGVSEFAHHQKNALLSPLKDAESLTKHIMFFLEHPEEARSMGRSGKHLLDGSWQNDVMVERIASAYRDLLKEKGYGPFH